MKAEVISSGETHDLSSSEETIIAAGPIVLVISGAEEAEIRLDGRRVEAVSTTNGRVLTADLKRSTGFHHLHVQPDFHFWFGTEDAKLGLEGIQEMLAFLRGECLQWSGQLLFTDGRYLRDPHVLYGWLDRNADDFFGVVQDIMRGPIKRSTSELRTTRSGGRGIDVANTLRALRRNPAERLEENPRGIIQLGSRRYMPQIVVSRRRTKTLDTVANRRVMWVLGQIQSLLLELRDTLPKGPEAERCEQWISTASILFTMSPLSMLARVATALPPSSEPSQEETVDLRYAFVKEVADELGVQLGWSANRDRVPKYSFVDYSDVIFQAFVANLLAEAEGLTRVSQEGGRGAIFENSDWRLVYDLEPEARVIRPWLSYTELEASFRPDVVLEDRSSGDVVVADAKYRRKGDAASESARKELLSYMAAFAIPKVAVFYPAGRTQDLAVRSYSWEEFELLEVPMKPGIEVLSYVQDKVLPSLKSLALRPRWRD